MRALAQRFAVALLAALVLVPVGVLAQGAYPSRPVELIIPFAPGGPTDIAFRLIQPQLSANLGVPLVLVNKAGGGGAIGMDGVAKARPDGYTLAATVRSTLTILPATQPDVPYKIADFAPIGAVAFDSGVIMVRRDAPWKTLEEFVDHVRKNPGKVTYGSAGLGTNSFFNMELLKQAYGLEMTHVPFGGSGPVKNAVLGGHVQAGVAGLSASASVIRSGDLIALVNTAPRRVASIPNVPTMVEKGHPDAALNTWMELYAPAKTPTAVIERVSQALEKTVKDPAVIAGLEKAGMVAEHHDPTSTKKLVEQEWETVSRVAKKMAPAK